MDASELIEKLADMNPKIDNDFGDTYCFFCGENLAGKTPPDHGHSDNCIWSNACKMVGKNE